MAHDVGVIAHEYGVLFKNTVAGFQHRELTAREYSSALLYRLLGLWQRKASRPYGGGRFNRGSGGRGSGKDRVNPSFPKCFLSPHKARHRNRDRISRTETCP